MKKILVLALLLASFLTFSQAADDKLTMTTTAGKTLHITGTEGGLVFDEYKGKIVFLEFFGHKCPPCIKSIPHYKNLQKKYKDKLAIVAVEVHGMSEAQLKAFVKENGINYTTVSQDKSGELVSYISVRAQWQGSIPFLVILDKKGDVQLVQVGMLPEEALEDAIKQLSK
ncbi:MAG: TlpA disulfide reductase family protein [Campylobacterota bacterium]|nr:TlpA disulfide reductase family protein [Campylobacterota bacterium]